MKTDTKETACPCCGRIGNLSLIRSNDGREWVNLVCRPCNMAMDTEDKWTLYAGGVKSGKQ